MSDLIIGRSNAGSFIRSTAGVRGLSKSHINGDAISFRDSVTYNYNQFKYVYKYSTNTGLGYPPDSLFRGTILGYAGIIGNESLIVASGNPGGNPQVRSYRMIFPFTADATGTLYLIMDQCYGFFANSIQTTLQTPPYAAGFELYTFTGTPGNAVALDSTYTTFLVNCGSVTSGLTYDLYLNKTNDDAQYAANEAITYPGIGVSDIFNIGTTKVWIQ